MSSNTQVTDNSNTQQVAQVTTTPTRVYQLWRGSEQWGGTFVIHERTRKTTISLRRFPTEHSQVFFVFNCKPDTKVLAINRKYFFVCKFFHGDLFHKIKTATTHHASSNALCATKPKRPAMVRWNALWSQEMSEVCVAMMQFILSWSLLSCQNFFNEAENTTCYFHPGEFTDPESVLQVHICCSVGYCISLVTYVSIS